MLSSHRCSMGRGANGRPSADEWRNGSGHDGYADPANVGNRSAHGHTIAHVIEHTSEDVLEVEQGSLYPARHRLEHRGWVTSNWGTSENNRKAKY
jgi:hypothetical protein